MDDHRYPTAVAVLAVSPLWLSQVMAPSLVVSLFGGLTAAILMWGEKNSSNYKFVRVIFLGLIVGTISAIVMTDYSTPGPGVKLGIVYLVAVIAHELLRRYKTIGPKIAQAWVIRRTTPPPEE